MPSINVKEVNTQIEVRNDTVTPLVNERLERIALLMANGSSMEEAAKITGVHVQSVKRWKTDLRFVKQVREFRRQLTEQTLGLMVKYQVDAVKEIHRLMMHSRMEPVRLGAAKALLENTRALIQITDLQDEIEELKEMLAARGGIEALETPRQQPTEQPHEDTHATEPTEETDCFAV